MTVSRLLLIGRKENLYYPPGEQRTKPGIILGALDQYWKPVILMQSSAISQELGACKCKRDDWESCKCEVFLMEQEQDI